MKINFTLLTSLLVCIILSCVQANKELLIDENKLLERLKILSSDDFEGRRTGERGNDSARAYIINEFKAIKAPSFLNSYEQPFTFEVKNKVYNANNILVEFKGTEHPVKYIVISAHHDHLGISNGEIYNGADDDASGVAALISFAEYFSKNPPRHSVILAVFDAEEIGLRGAKYFIDNIESKTILLNINIDMIGRSPKNQLYAVGGRYNASLRTILNEFKNPTETQLLQGHDGTDGKQDWTMSSDHRPFYKANIPFLYFGNEDHKDYHRPSDEFEYITPRFYKNAVKIILGVFNDIDVLGL